MKTVRIVILVALFAGFFIAVIPLHKHTELKYGVSYFTNITSDAQVDLEPARRNVFETSLFLVTNSTPIPRQITIGTHAYWITNGVLTEIIVEHYGHLKEQHHFTLEQ